MAYSAKAKATASASRRRPLQLQLRVLAGVRLPEVRVVEDLTRVTIVVVVVGVVGVVVVVLSALPPTSDLLPRSCWLSLLSLHTHSSTTLVTR